MQSNMKGVLTGREEVLKMAMVIELVLKLPKPFLLKLSFLAETLPWRAQHPFLWEACVRPDFFFFRIPNEEVGYPVKL